MTAAFLQGFVIDREVSFLCHLLRQKQIIHCGDSKSQFMDSVTLLERGTSLRSLRRNQESRCATNSSLDSALFYLRKDSDLLGLICSHVDDFFFNGSQLFHTQVIEHLRTEFSLSQELFDQMSFIGIEISQNSEGITMHQKAYIEELEPIQLTDTSKGRLLDKGEVRLLKGLIGQLQWIAKLTRPDIAFDTSDLSSKVKAATTDDVKRANKVVRKVKSDSYDDKNT